MAGRKFEIGETYETRSACDYNCIFSFEVINRTAKRITLKCNNTGDVHKRGVTAHLEMGSNEEHEACYPLGRYSMAPFLRA